MERGSRASAFFLPNLRQKLNTNKEVYLRHDFIISLFTEIEQRGSFGNMKISIRFRKQIRTTKPPLPVLLTHQCGKLPKLTAVLNYISVLSALKTDQPNESCLLVRTLSLVNPINEPLLMPIIKHPTIFPKVRCFFPISIYNLCLYSLEQVP